MAFITSTNLGRLLIDEESNAREIKLAEMVAAGVTSGVPTIGDEPWKIQRTWTTEASATEWLSFMNSLTPGPVSATIVEE